MVDWLKVFRSVAEQIRRETAPIFGTIEAGRALDRGVGGDITKYIDALAENIVITRLIEEDIACVLVSEECGTKVLGRNPRDYVVLDGIDGTTNATRGISFVSTSLAHAKGPSLSDVDIALVMDLCTGITFSARRGKGSWEGTVPLQPSEITDLHNAVIGIELPGKLQNNKHCLDRLIPLIVRGPKFRHLGSIALELCYVASARLDAFVDIREIARSTDFAAAYLIIKEAGGLMLSPEGKRINVELKATSRLAFIATANSAIASKIVALLNSVT